MRLSFTWTHPRLDSLLPVVRDSRVANCSIIVQLGCFTALNLQRVSEHNGEIYKDSQKQLAKRTEFARATTEGHRTGQPAPHLFAKHPDCCTLGPTQCRCDEAENCKRHNTTIE